MLEESAIANVPPEPRPRVGRIEAHLLREPGEQKLLKQTTLVLAAIYVFAIGVTLSIFLGWILLALLTVRVLRSRYLSEAIEIDDEQLPQVWELVRRCAARLGAPAPRLFVSVDPGAYPVFTVPVPEPAILLHAHWVKILTPEELEFFISHEIAHGQLGHRRLLDPINVLDNVGAISWVLTTPLELMRYAMRPWARLADFSADRVALACVGGKVEVAAAALAKTTAGEELCDDVDVAGYIKQAKRLSDHRMLTLHEIATGRLGSARRLSRLICFAESPRFAELCEPREVPVRRGLMSRLFGSSGAGQTGAVTVPPRSS